MADQLSDERWQKTGMTWIHAIADHDFQQLSRVCQPDVSSRLVIPSQVNTCENINSLIGAIQGWFGSTSQTQVEYARVDQVGHKIAINYRFTFQEEGEWRTAEQQVYGFLRDGLISKVDLLCSGFQLVPERDDFHEDTQAEFRQDENPSKEPVLPDADALLVFNTKSGAQGPTCSVLTPAIKSRLSELHSGQVLEVRVDDPEAKGDIESWCRLSGNELLAMTTPEQPPEERGNLWFYLKKK